jgi:hypothetical protein
MIIFRFEHNRDVCVRDIYTREGESLTGHGTFTNCQTAAPVPNFGMSGIGPSSIMYHERVAVTADQWTDWISGSRECRYLYASCRGDWYCADCPRTTDKLNIPDDWDIVAYWVDDYSEDTDWRVTNNQIVFNPAFAELIGSVELWEVDQFVKAGVS